MSASIYHKTGATTGWAAIKHPTGSAQLTPRLLGKALCPSLYAVDTEYTEYTENTENTHS